MKGKKWLSLLLLCVSLFVVTGCTPKTGNGNGGSTHYEDMEITKIETAWQDGFAAFAGDYVRTFDFQAGTVSDTRVTNADISEILENTSGFTADDFNNPKRVAAFTQEQAEALFEKIKAWGFLTWEDRYVTQDIIYDGGDFRVSVYFADGTKKSTYIYFEYPPKYQEIRQAFQEHLGVTFYFGW